MAHDKGVHFPLHCLYTNDLPWAGPGCLDTLFADDITQEITTPSKSKLMLKFKIEREIELINKYEREWKIQTREGKLKIFPIAQYKKMKIKVSGKEIDTCKEGKFQGLKYYNPLALLNIVQMLKTTQQT